MWDVCSRAPYYGAHMVVDLGKLGDDYVMEHRQENRRLVGHFYDMKNLFWAVGFKTNCI